MSLPLDETLSLITRRISDNISDADVVIRIRDEGATWRVTATVLHWTGRKLGAIEAESYSAAKALELVAQECAGWTPAAEDAA